MNLKTLIGGFLKMETDKNKDSIDGTLSKKIKEFAENAEGLFVMAKEQLSGFKSNFTNDNKGVSEESSIKDKVKNLDPSQLLQFAEQFFSQYIEPMAAQYIKKHMDFKSSVEVKIKRLENFKGNIPQYESLGASGLDVRAQLDSPLTIKPSERILVPTGLSMEVPVEYEIQARPRSGLSLKKGLTLVNTPGTIDADYRGEIKMIMINLGTEDVVIEDQERIAQLVICPVVKAKFTLSDDLSDTTRGSGGFGSTGSH